MDEEQDVYLRPETIRKKFDVTPCTLRDWSHSGKIKSIKKVVDLLFLAYLLS